MNAELLANSIAHKLSIPHLIARILVARGCESVSKAYARVHSTREDVLNPLDSKQPMCGMDAALAWIIQAKHSGEELCIFGDYDMDGLTGTAVLKRGLSEIGIDASWHLPCRFGMGSGYGLSTDVVDQMLAENVRYLLTVDTGITANAEIEYAKSKGMRVMIIDHHEPSGDGLPPSDVLLDPCQDDCLYPNKSLCGVGVSYKFIDTLFQKEGKGSADKYLDLVALGTLADLVEMTPENRYLTRSGLSRLLTSAWPGVRELCRRQLENAPYVGGQDVLFRIAPLMNAPGRMDKPDVALELLLCDDAAKASALLDNLSKYNDLRKKTEADISKAAIDWVNDRYGEKLPHVLVVDGKSWHPGVIGIVAAKVAQTFNRPSAVLTVENGIAQASARAIPGFNWHKALFEVRDLFLRWGGHANAAGFSLKEEDIPVLRERLQRWAEDQNAAAFGEPVEENSERIPAALNEITPDLMNALQNLEPFGGKNPYPILFTENVQVEKLRELRGGHLQLKLSQSGSPQFAAIAFGMANAKKIIEAKHKKISIAFEPVWNVFAGRKSIQLLIKSIS